MKEENPLQLNGTCILYLYFLTLCHFISHDPMNFCESFSLQGFKV